MNTDKNNSKKINGTLIKESLMDYNNLAQQLKENITDGVKSLLDEQVKQAYAAILNESEDDDKEKDEYDVEEVDDTNDDATEVENDDENSDDVEADVETDDEDGTEPEESQDDTEDITDVEGDDMGDLENDDFEQFKVSDNEYDFRNAKDEDIVKIYKRLKNDDQVTVVKDGDKLSISDNETDAEYIIDLGDDDAEANLNDEIEMDNMTESRIYEIALNEYDSHLGYTDNYQDKDVMTNDGVDEPGDGRDIDAGVPHNAKKPWSNKKDGKPFTMKTKTNECGDAPLAPEMDETVVEKGGTDRGMAKSHVPNTEDQKNSPYKHKASAAGVYQESITKKANKIFEENKKLKEQLNKITDMLKEAAVTNVNLGGIIKLISENSTTKDEKRNIINRFTNEAHTVEESKSLYKTISDELSKSPKNQTNINEEMEFGSSNAEVINESKFYQDESVIESLGLMHKICK